MRENILKNKEIENISKLLSIIISKDYLKDHYLPVLRTFLYHTDI